MRLPDPHTLDLVLNEQLATLQFGDLDIVRRRMGHRFGDFIVEGTVLPLKFSNMRVDGHWEWLLSGISANTPDWIIVP